MKGCEFVNCTIDLTNSPDEVAFNVYVVDSSSWMSRAKGWWLDLKFKFRMRRFKSEVQA